MKEYQENAQQAYREREKAKGIVFKQVRVPKDRSEEIVEIARRMRETK